MKWCVYFLSTKKLPDRLTLNITVNFLTYLVKTYFRFNTQRTWRWWLLEWRLYTFGFMTFFLRWRQCLFGVIYQTVVGFRNLSNWIFYKETMSILLQFTKKSYFYVTKQANKNSIAYNYSVHLQPRTFHPLCVFSIF